MEKTQLKTLFDNIYNAPPNTPHCAHCGRPLLFIKAGGATQLFCKHCTDLAKEEAQSQSPFVGND